MVDEVAHCLPLNLIAEGLSEDISSHAGTDLVYQSQMLPLEYLVQPRYRYPMGAMQVAHRGILTCFYNPNHRLIVLEKANTWSIRQNFVPQVKAR